MVDPQKRNEVETLVSGIVHMISEITGGVLISGVMAWYLMLAIAKTGVLDRLASGRALIERRA